MTEKQKKIAIVIGVVVIAVIILLSRKSAPGIIVNQNGAAPINVTIPGFNIPERSPIAINIPGLPAASPYDYNAISPCMCNGSATALPTVAGPSITFVTNEGNSGPNVYNYTDLWHDGINGDAVAAGCIPGTPCYYGYNG